MQVLFDKFNLYEIPNFTLCNPDGQELYSLGGIFDRQYKSRFNALSEISFTAPYQIDGVKTDYYDYLVYRRLVLLEDFGYFMITDVEEDDDGKRKEKKVVCQSIEFEMTTKRLVNYSGTKKFYDFISPSATLLGEIITYLPDWSIGTVDTDLATLYRTFDESDTTIYNFLMTTVEDSYQCVFVFDPILKTISAHSVANATTATDIYISHDNLIKNISVKEISDELCTALTVKGAGNLSIAQVNPLGTDVIYNFSYFKNTGWMAQTLIDSITSWEDKIIEKQTDYANLLTTLRDSNEELVTLKSELVDLQAEYDALDGVRAVRIQQGLDYSDINAQLVTKQTEINSKIEDINSINSIIGNPQISYISGSFIESNNVPQPGSLLYELEEINDYVSFQNNFTVSQLTELSRFILGSTYNNENFVQTDLMTEAEIQDQAQELYNQAVGVLEKTCVPRYEFTVDSVNFVFLKEFQTFIDQLELGCVVTLEVKDDTYVYPVLLGIDVNYDAPNEFSLIFGNRLRLDDSSYIYTDLLGQTVRQGITTSFNSEQWGNWNRNYKDDVSTFINSALNASLNMVVSGSTQNVIINQNGLRGRSSIGTNQYSPEQVWLINNMLAFTDDNWETAKLALGKISTTSGSSFGLVAETVVGRLIAGNNLTIANDNNTFTVDGSGATLTNATFSITTTNGKSKILLDPTNGIKIQGLTGGSWQDKFYADSSGNLTFSGALSGATGTFSGTLSAATISGGTITGTSIVGGTISGTTGTFSGNVYAANLTGLVTSDQINSLIASKIGAGTMSGVNLSGTRGTIKVGNADNLAITSSNGMVLQDTSGVGISLLASAGMYLGGNLRVTGNSTLDGSVSIPYGNLTVNGYINTSQYYASGQPGWSGNITYYNGSAYKTMTFSKGLLLGTT